MKKNTHKKSVDVCVGGGGGMGGGAWAANM